MSVQGFVVLRTFGKESLSDLINASGRTKLCHSFKRVETYYHVYLFLN